MKGASGLIIQRREDRNAIEKREGERNKNFFLMSEVRIELGTSSSIVLNSTIYTDGLDDSQFEHDYLNSKSMFYRSGVRSPRRASFSPFSFSLCLCSRFLALSFFLLFVSFWGIFLIFLYFWCFITFTFFSFVVVMLCCHFFGFLVLFFFFLVFVFCFCLVV